MDCGLYADLSSTGTLVKHQEADNISSPEPELAYKIIKPERIPFISHPYEWCFSQMKNAALLTLDVHEKALDAGMSLKDASSFNIQFLHGKPIFIDSLSFEVYQEGQPWVAYRQFCQHFLAPLSLMSLTDVRLSQLSRVFIDGIPLDLASTLLPLTTRLNAGLLAHIHLHAKSQARFADTSSKSKERQARTATAKLSLSGMRGLVASLRSTVKKLTWEPHGTEWGNYYNDTNYSADAMQQKMIIVDQFLDRAAPASVWDLGANTGVFSRIASRKGIRTVAFDIDPAAVEKNYTSCILHNERDLLPLVHDLTNPSPSIGWQNKERESFFERGPADTVLALALIHHLAIANNVPLGDIAFFFAGISHFLIIEFVPKDDSQVQRLLSGRLDIFTDYSQASFERAFEHYFTILEARGVMDTSRVIYLMRLKSYRSARLSGSRAVQQC